jgi:uncharacterized membrane protein
MHIICGGLSLLSGSLILMLPKGNTFHKKAGKLFFLGMLVNALVAIPMTYLQPNLFLFLIAIFTLYMLITGKFYLRKKNIDDVNYFDWLLTLVIALFGIGFISFGIVTIGNQNLFGIVYVVFGSVGFLFSYQDYVNYTGKSPFKNYFLTTHIQRMVGSFIATLTAFLVVNNSIFPGFIAWLLPTVMLTPLLLFWTRKHRVLKDQKFLKANKEFK